MLTPGRKGHSVSSQAACHPVSATPDGDGKQPAGPKAGDPWPFKGSLTAGAGGGGALTGGGSTHRQAPGGQEGGPGTHSRALQCCPGPGLWEEERALGLSRPKDRHIPSEDARREGRKVQMVGFSVRTGALGGSLPGCRALEVTRAHGWATTPMTSPSGGPMSMWGCPRPHEHAG